MRVLVTSDTHLSLEGDPLPQIIKKEAKQSDCCIHAGDFINCKIYEELKALTEVYAVCGNMDDQSVTDLLPKRQIISLGEVTVGLVHGRGAPSHLIEYIDEEFKDDRQRIDIFIFGHSHFPFDKEIGGKIYFNPGSCVDTVFAPYRSYGILDIEGKVIKRRIVKIG